jgi:hypothetical protein
MNTETLKHFNQTAAETEAWLRLIEAAAKDAAVALTELAAAQDRIKPL